MTGLRRFWELRNRPLSDRIESNVMIQSRSPFSVGALDGDSCVWGGPVLGYDHEKL